MARKTRKQPLLALPASENKHDITYRAGLYLRLSVESQAEMENNSLGHQKEICMDYLREKPEIQIWETYIDNGLTGTTFDRKEFQRMVADLQAGTINCVVVKDLSRFGRNYLDVDEYLNEKFPAWGVRFISVLERFDTSVPGKDSSLIIPFRNILNYYYVQDFSQKVRSSFQAKMERGEFLGNSFNTPYGYIRDVEKRTFRINPETAPTVQMMFQLRADGASLCGIAKLFNQNGVPCPTRYLYEKGATKLAKYAEQVWTYGTVRTILNNEVYLGHRIHHKQIYAYPGDKRRITALEEQIRILNAHEPLVSKELFDKVQQLNQATKERSKRLNHLPKPDCDFRDGIRGNIYCGDCGARIIFQPSKYGKNRNVLFTRCTLNRKDHRRCSLHSISMIKLAGILEQELNRQVDLMQTTQRLLSQSASESENSQTDLRRQLQSVQVKRKHLENRKRALMEDYINHVLDKEEYFAFMDKYDTDAVSLAESEAVLQSKLSEYSSLLEKAKQWRSVVQDYQSTRELTNELLREVVDRIDLLQQDKTLTVKISFRYQDVYQKALQYAGGGDCADNEA